MPSKSYQASGFVSLGVPEGANAVRRMDALAGLIAVIGLGVLGYMLLGLTFLEAL